MTDASASISRLAVDAGQTGVKLRLLERRYDGVALHDFEAPPVRTSEPVLPQIAEAARQVARSVSRPMKQIAVGATGLTGAEFDAESLLGMTTDVGTEKILLTHDSVTSYIGSLGDATGVVVAAGTGVVTLAVGPSSVARVDGWGNIMGDAGSGYWIGQRALSAAMRAYDGRGPLTELLDIVREQWSCVEDAYVALQSHPDRIRVVASFAERVTRLAQSDDVAAHICEDAAAELAHSAVTAWNRVTGSTANSSTSHSRSDIAPLVASIGGVFRSDLISEHFRRRLRESIPTAQIVPQRGTALDGASALFSLPESHPLHALVSTAISHADPHDSPLAAGLHMP